MNWWGLSNSLWLRCRGKNQKKNTIALTFLFHNANDIWEQIPWEIICIFISISSQPGAGSYVWLILFSAVTISEWWSSNQGLLSLFHSVATLLRFSFCTNSHLIYKSWDYDRQNENCLSVFLSGGVIVLLMW